MHERRIAYRISDANWNRIAEGLRTLEDVSRFIDCANLQSRYKELRHALTHAMRVWDQSELLASRNADADVGRGEKQPAELARTNGLRDIVASASGRCEQGLRVLEETAKFLHPETAAEIESVRYRIYDCNAELHLALRRDVAFLQRSQLYVLVDCQEPLDRFTDMVASIANAGVDLVQIRDKRADGSVLVRYANAAVAAVDRERTRIIVNDRIDIASCSNAWGAHVGQEDIPPNAARSLMRGDQILGVSTHDLAQIEKAIADGADYLGCGPTFPSKTKGFTHFPGLDFLSEAARYLAKRSAATPAFAIGGITPDNLERVIAAGFDRVAVSSCVWNADDPPQVARLLKETLLASRGGRVT